jgi:hypothetical protein
MTHRVVDIGPVRESRTDAGHRVTADVDGAPVWFESPDLELRGAMECFASVFLMPALHRGARLRLASGVDPVWRHNTEEAMSVLRSWWRYPVRPIDAPASGPASSGTPSPAGIEEAVDPLMALYFSGGVDSFHVLLRGQPRPGVVVMLQGFDIPLDDLPRARAAEAGMRVVAAGTGSRPIVVRTNAREHPLVAATPWERAHGGVLGGVAHLLEPAARRVAIAASAPGDELVPWGSHWRIDPLWSSSRVSVMHVNHGSRRIDKLREIAAHPLVREQLRVCWRNLAPTGNCSRCPKCVLVMLILEECGELASSRVFEGRGELAARIDGLPKARDRAHTFEELAASPRLDPHIAAAASRLARRSRYEMRRDVRMRRAVIRWLVSRAPRTGKVG